MALFDWRDKKRIKAKKAAEKKAKAKAEFEKSLAISVNVEKIYKKYKADLAKLGYGPDRMPFGTIDQRQ